MDEYEFHCNYCGQSFFDLNEDRQCPVCQDEGEVITYEEYLENEKLNQEE